MTLYFQLNNVQDQDELQESSDSTISSFKVLKEKQSLKREERQEKIKIKTDEKKTQIIKAEKQEKKQKQELEKQDLLTNFLVQSINNSQIMMSQFLQKDKAPLVFNQNSPLIDSQNVYQQSSHHVQQNSNETLETSLTKMKKDMKDEIVSELKTFLSDLLKK